ncbi:MAG TPA: TRAP transporter large permease [Anaerovoracaceae bacterium]|nr:TRAP transporter large permease [Anaerovoracaceae bacterium]
MTAMVILIVLFVVMIGLIFLGVPISFSIGLSGLAIMTFFNMGVPFTLITAKTFAGMNSYTLMAIPFFILGGELMDRAGITKMIVDLADSCVGFLKAGLSYVTVLSATLISGLSGSGTADAAAIGSVLIPSMSRKGYTTEYAVALVTASCTLGPIIPPSTLFILYAYYTNVSIVSLFLAGILPGIVIAVILMITAKIVCARKGFAQETSKFSIRYVGRAFANGWVALVAPLAIIAALRFGWATPTEGGVLISIMAILVGLFYRTITSFRQIVDSIVAAAKGTCTVLALVGFSGIFADIMVRCHFQENVSKAVTNFAHTPLTVLVTLCVFLFILGIFVDTTPMLIMFSAAFAGVAASYGIDLVHFGVIFVLICMLGAVTPPVGGTLFIAAAIGKVSIMKCTPMLIPFIIALFIANIVLVLFPAISTWLPNLIL